MSKVWGQSDFVTHTVCTYEQASKYQLEAVFIQKEAKDLFQVKAILLRQIFSMQR